MAEGEKNMKAGIHPEYMDCTVTCACGETFTTKSNKKEIFYQHKGHSILKLFISILLTILLLIIWVIIYRIIRGND